MFLEDDFFCGDVEHCFEWINGGMWAVGELIWFIKTSCGTEKYT